MIHGLAATSVTVFATTHYLDEAEHAGRVGMIDAGVLKALATPEDFKAHFLNGRLYAVTCDRTMDALVALAAVPGVSDVSLYGESIHVLTDDLEATALSTPLDALGARDVVVARIAPSLEDVFISLMKRR